MQTDHYCLLDFLELLMMDNEAYLLLHHQDFNYNRIGVKSSPTGLKFKSFNKPIKLDQLTWHQSRLNLSILAKIEGQVTLPPNPFNIDVYDTFIYRNYTLIKDGVLNIDKLPVLLSKHSIDILNKHNLSFFNNGAYVIDLTKLPIVNKQICSQMTNASKLAIQSIRKLQLECHMKVLNSKMVDIKELLAVDKELFLASYGIKDGCFSPPSIANSEVKQEMVKAFVIKIQGSLMPKVDDVVKGKKLNICGHFMKEIIDVADEDVTEQYSLTKKELKLITSTILKTKFALILCNQWVDQSEVMVGHTKVSFILENLKVFVDK